MVSAAAAVLVIAGCEQPAPAVEPEEALAPAVEGVDPAVLAALPEGATVEMVEEGRQLYVVCSVCHGLDGRGTQLGPSLRDGEWIHIGGELGEIQEITRTGVQSPEEYPVPMPRMGGGAFDEQQLRAVALYVHAISRSAP
jgi:mono/diheme cytochrome c family protein